MGYEALSTCLRDHVDIQDYSTFAKDMTPSAWTVQKSIVGLHIKVMKWTLSENKECSKEVLGRTAAQNRCHHGSIVGVPNREAKGECKKDGRVDCRIVEEWVDRPSVLPRALLQGQREIGRSRKVREREKDIRPPAKVWWEEIRPPAKRRRT